MYGSRFAGCPLHNLIPEWNDLIFKGQYGLAYSRLAKTSSFPEFTSRVCPALCESICTCGVHGDPVTVKDNERFLSDYAWKNGLVKPRVPAARTGKTVAVVGSGPAGLAAADLLNRMGHSVTVFEKEELPGGLLVWGIPSMKLEKGVVARRIKLMEEEGVTFRCGTDIGRNVSGAELTENFDAVVLCCGSGKVREYKVEGSAEGFCYASDYLKASTHALLGDAYDTGLNAKGKNVIVVGAGDTSCDCIGTALRQGCRSVIQLIRRDETFYAPAEKSWPDMPRGNIDYAEEEAEKIYGASPRRYGTVVKALIADENGCLKQVRTVKLRWTNEGGKPVSEEIPGSEEILECELLIAASGFAGCEEYVCDTFGLAAEKRGNLESHDGCLTANEKIFAAGDMRRGASLVVHAIADGREAAIQTDEYLKRK
jgi:glutamate synthase (NADPH/NADH) small chain